MQVTKLESYLGSPVKTDQKLFYFEYDVKPSDEKKAGYMIYGFEDGVPQIVSSEFDIDAHLIV